MADMGRGQPAVDEPLHTFPLDTSLLTPPFENVMPEVTDREAKVGQSVPVSRYAEVANMPTYNGLQPCADFRNRVMHTPPQLDLHLLQLGLHALANGVPKHHKPSLLRLPADMRKAEEIEGLRFAQTNALSVGRRMVTELEKPRLFRVQLQLELLHTFFQFRPEPFGLVFELESNHDVVGVTHDDYIAVRTLSSPCLNPEIEDVMKVDIRQQRRCTATLRRAFLRERSHSLFQHARVQPFLDEPQDAPVRYPVLEEPDQPLVRQPIEKAAHVQVQHPVHTSLVESTVQGVQRFVLAASWPEPVREAEEVGFVDGVEHLHRRSLDELVLKRRDAERSLPPVRLGDVHPTHRLGPVRSALQSMGEALEIILKCLAVVPPRFTVYTSRSLPLQLRVGEPQSVDSVNVMHQSGELYILVRSCRLSYLRQLTRRVYPALSPERVLLAQIPFGQTPSLHLLRHWCSGFVRKLLRYYESVRLPVFVHHRLLSLDFPMRPASAGRSRENPGSPNFRARCVPTCQGHRPRRTPVKLAFTFHRMLPSASCQSVGVLKFGVFRGSITWPVVPPVNASYLALRPCPHDSEPVWFATPSPYDSFIRYILPAWCGLHRVPPKSIATALQRARCLRTGLALRHVIPNG
jgi:hypothetical protein